ncbi:Dihydroxyacetone synthase [Saitozyma podzolica]|uniref:Dihydroxyacetone synthase n=1 Tax=Saitozyma podzolica TaxID=1890683 RepID=A0A427YJI6_9TREE|nr:Dihydroxyacetone synthase [Saitozyma podzolica]
MRATLSFLAVLALAFTAEAATYVGCLDEKDTFPTDQCSEVSNVNKNDDCVTACKTDKPGKSSYRYSFFIGGKTTTPACYCSDHYPFVNTTVAGKTDKKGKIDEKHRCFADTFYATDLTTSFTFDKCYKDVGTPDNKCDKLVDTPQDCFDYCKWYDVALWSFPDPSTWTSSAEDGLECWCGSDKTLAGSNEIVCPKWGDKGYYRFTHPVASHGYGKRQEAKRALLQAQKAFSHCPGGMQACLVNGADGESFECIDTHTELESCGGCTMGYFQPKQDVPLGVE